MDKPITISSLYLGLTLCSAEFFNANKNIKKENPRKYFKLPRT